MKSAEAEVVIVDGDEGDAAMNRITGEDTGKACNVNEVQEAIINLLHSYNNKGDVPSVFEVMSIACALPFVEGVMEEKTYLSYQEWVERHKSRYEEEINNYFRL
ncbi:hypothetical protein K0T92_04860 [Paenibacillus oenotherae]|uniref:Uncharacterized protein n=1 Tax=Paenibacillus oenotherae TaxID=1435645 RepID=A0ABS7D2C6_9BACL|nr:hypothetical protein [Paenibacillus oenotherae]MBW7474063.1 hypothetical protein [Paenibacillus oenotherae]